MGVREDQLVGYFGADVTAVGHHCHAGLCAVGCLANCEIDGFISRLAFGQIESINNNLPGDWYKVDMDKVNALSPDIIVDAAYCHQPEDCAKDAET